MKTITYTYDERKPTNRDYLIEALTGSIEDGGASYESVARYNIACPYICDSDCLNSWERNKYDTKEYENACVRCKCAWLESSMTLIRMRMWSLKLKVYIPKRGQKPTNGDVIKALYPNFKIEERSHTVWVGNDNMSFCKDWWNAPYKRKLGDIDEQR